MFTLPGTSYCGPQGKGSFRKTRSSFDASCYRHDMRYKTFYDYFRPPPNFADELFVQDIEGERGLGPGFARAWFRTKGKLYGRGKRVFPGSFRNLARKKKMAMVAYQPGLRSNTRSDYYQVFGPDYQPTFQSSKRVRGPFGEYYKKKTAYKSRRYRKYKGVSYKGNKLWWKKRYAKRRKMRGKRSFRKRGKKGNLRICHYRN